MRVEGGTVEGEDWAGEVTLLRTKRTTKKERKEKIRSRNTLFGRTGVVGGGGTGKREGRR
jgi:hypothetical protein